MLQFSRAQFSLLNDNGLSNNSPKLTKLLDLK